MKLGDIYDNVFYLNLDRHKDRRNHMEKILSEKNLNYQRISGIDVKKIPENILNSYDENLNTGPSQDRPVVIAVSLSHRKIWKKIIDEDLPYAVILEDDIQFSEYFESTKNVSLPDDWDVLVIGNSKAEWPRDTCDPFPNPQYNINGEKGPILYNQNLIKIIHKDETPMGAYGYVITNKTAHYLYENWTLEHPVDVFLLQENINNLNIYATIPSPVIHCFKYGSNTSIYIPITKNVILYLGFLLFYSIYIYFIKKKFKKNIIQYHLIFLFLYLVFYILIQYLYNIII
jgi:glycosyl transferase family 25